MSPTPSPRTYPHAQFTRAYTPGRRRFSAYWSWSYPLEVRQDPTAPEAIESRQLALSRFQQLIGDLTGHPVAVYQRVDQAGQSLPMDAGLLDDTDTLMIFGLDHLVTEQDAASAEIEAIARWLERDDTCLILAPHHDIGVSADARARAMEYAHHRDPLVTREQRFGRYARSVMKGLDVPVYNQYGLRPATMAGTNRLQPLSKYRDLDIRGWLEGVETFNFHPHLPHYAITTRDRTAIHLLAQQPIDLSMPHPFTEAGQRELNMFLWMPPTGERAGDILLADSTIFMTPVEDGDNLERFWTNIATK